MDGKTLSHQSDLLAGRTALRSLLILLFLAPLSVRADETPEGGSDRVYFGPAADTATVDTAAAEFAPAPPALTDEEEEERFLSELAGDSVYVGAQVYRAPGTFRFVNNHLVNLQDVPESDQPLAPIDDVRRNGRSSRYAASPDGFFQFVRRSVAGRRGSRFRDAAHRRAVSGGRRHRRGRPGQPGDRVGLARHGLDTVEIAVGQQRLDVPPSDHHTALDSHLQQPADLLAAQRRPLDGLAVGSRYDRQQDRFGHRRRCDHHQGAVQLALRSATVVHRRGDRPRRSALATAARFRLIALRSTTTATATATWPAMWATSAAATGAPA